MVAAGLASLFTWAVLQSPSVPRVIQTVAATVRLTSARDQIRAARDTVEKTFRDRLALARAGHPRENRIQFGGHPKGARRYPQGAGG